MRKNIHVKSTMRQPVRTLFLLLLIGAMSFAFIARVTEYIIVQRETDRLGGYYRAIGTLVPQDPNVYHIAEGAAIVEASRYTAISDRHKYASAFLADMDNVDFNSIFSDDIYSLVHSKKLGFSVLGNRSTDILFCGVLTEIHALTDTDYQLIFEIDRVETSRSEYLPTESKEARVVYYFPGKDEAAEFKDSLQIGSRYFVRSYFNLLQSVMLGNTIFVDEHLSALRYLAARPLNGAGLLLLPKEPKNIGIGSYSKADLEIQKENMAARYRNSDLRLILPMEPGASVDYNASLLSELREDMERQKENRRAIMVIGTKDMSAIHYFQNTSRAFLLTDGRWLDANDELNARRVCAVSDNFAKIRKLSVGDTLTLTFRDLNYPFYFGYILDLEGEGWRDLPTHTETFEIVGIYSQLGQEKQYVANAESGVIYIPDSSIPSGYGKYLPDSTPYLAAGDWFMQYTHDSYSFLLDSARSQDAFVVENRAALAKLGFDIKFVENGSKNFWSSAGPLNQMAELNAGIFGVLLALTLGLSVFLYLKNRGKDFAVSRALGMPKSKVVRQTLIPLILTGGLGILVGGILSWNYATGKAADTLSGIQAAATGAAVSVNLSPVWLMGLCVGVFALLMVFASGGAYIIARRPVLELLQGMAGKEVKK